MKKCRVLVLLNDYHLPPKNADVQKFDREEVPWVSNYDVIKQLKENGHGVEVVPVESDLVPIKSAIDAFKPHIVFNLLVEFKHETVYDQNVLAYLELLGISYTGCNPRAYRLARDKILAKKLFEYHGILTPRFHAFPHKSSAEAHELNYPLIVKCSTEDASLGMSQRSLVTTEGQLRGQIEHLHEHYFCDVIVEEFIEGRELYVGVLGNRQITTFPPWELVFAQSQNPSKEFYHTYAKWNTAYRKRKGIGSQKADLPLKIVKKLQIMAKQAYETLQLNGYARFDFRMTKEGHVYLIEANPNPDLSITEDFAVSAQAAGVGYGKLIDRILTLGLRRSLI